MVSVTRSGCWSSFKSVIEAAEQGSLDWEKLTLVLLFGFKT